MKSYETNYYNQNSMQAQRVQIGSAGAGEYPPNQRESSDNHYGLYGFLLIMLSIILFIVAFIPFDRITNTVSDFNNISWGSSSTNEYSSTDDIEILSTFVDEDKWCELTYEEKIEIGKRMITIEAKALELPNYKIRLKPIQGLREKRMGGYYDDLSKLIAIDKDTLIEARGQDILNIICHECRHSKQHRLAESSNRPQFLSKLSNEDYQFGKICYKNFMDYKDINNDYEAYYNQPVEVDARAYAEQQVAYYASLF